LTALDAPKTCAVDGCDAKHFSRSLCKRHDTWIRNAGTVSYRVVVPTIGGVPLTKMPPLIVNTSPDEKWRAAKITANNRRFRLRNKYNLTPDQADALLESQGGACAICKEDDPTGGWVVDHDHESGEVRGILCRKCNSGIGLLKDNADVLRAAMNYLERHASQQIS